MEQRFPRNSCHVAAPCALSSTHKGPEATTAELRQWFFGQALLRALAIARTIKP